MHIIGIGGNVMRKQLYALVLFVLVLLLLFQSQTSFDSSQPYLSEHHTTVAPVVAGKENNVYDKLEEAANAYNQPPIDAVVDKVWKAVPGYNGRIVDMKASYEAMEDAGQFKENLLVFKEIPPEVHLEDLPPAPIYKGNSEKPMASFIVNVSWGEEYLPQMLKVLREERTKATFFLEGRWVQKNPKLAKMIVEEGHEIGSHAYSHPDLNATPVNKIHQELQQTNESIEAVLSITPSLFAPPSGSYNDQVVEIAAKMGMHTILWTVDTIDWKSPDPMQMAEKTAAKTDNGSIILMHPTSSAVQGLQPLIRSIKEKDIQLDTVSELIDESRVD